MAKLDSSLAIDDEKVNIVSKIKITKNNLEKIDANDILESIKLLINYILSKNNRYDKLFLLPNYVLIIQLFKKTLNPLYRSPWVVILLNPP